MPTCKNCQQQFTIYPEDKIFYNKINVPEPTFCPDCRCQSRLAWRNERILYPRQCDSCQKNIISFYSPDKPYLQYCPDCWWGDKWAAPVLDYDPSVPFLKQYNELLLKTPHLAMISTHGLNSDYCAHSADYKDCYRCISGIKGEELYYCYWVINSSESADCALSFELQKCYECVHCRNLFNGIFCFDCEGCSDIAFCLDCFSCHNCLGCVGLRHKQYQIFNQPVSPQKFAQALAEAKTDPFKFYQEFYQFSLKFPRIFARLRHCEKSTGEYLYNCTDSHHCFEGEELEECAYLWNIPQGASAMHDAAYAATNEMSFNNVSIIRSKYLVSTCTCWDCAFLTYCFQCFYSNNLFGCAGQKHGGYKILNKKYSEGEYKKLVSKIKMELISQDKYGQFFPIEFSPFTYNESIAQEYYPLSRDEVIKNNWQWQDNLPSTIGKETAKNIPRDISQIDDSFVNEILACTVCGRNYKIIVQELKFYKDMGLPIPQECFDCRHLRRLKQRNPHKLWQRQCMCQNTNHGHKGRCTSQFATTYAPNRPELVYCEDCYNKEIY
ncbi:MAG: hypothetical protein WC480_04595 [Patescibacteria group bacterium]